MADVPAISLDPYLLGVQATLQLLQQLGLIPDLNPLDYIISAFDGKPQLADTEAAALRLQSSPWWPLRALGNNLQIWVRNGVPLSTGIAADRQELSQWIQGTIDSIEPIVYGRFDPYALDHAIWLAMTSQFGDQAIRQLNDEIANQHALGPLPTPPAPQPAPGPVPTEVGWHVSTAGDELADLGDTLVFQNTLIYNTLQAILAGMGQGTNAECCAKIETSLHNIRLELSAIAQSLSGAGLAADLTAPIEAVATAINVSTGFVKQLADCVCALEQNLSGASVDLTPLVNAVNQLAVMLGNPNLDLKRLADNSDLIASDADPDGDAFVNYLVQIGSLSAEAGRLIIGQG